MTPCVRTWYPFPGMLSPFLKESLVSVSMPRCARLASGPDGLMSRVCHGERGRVGSYSQEQQEDGTGGGVTADERPWSRAVAAPPSLVVKETRTA